MSSEVCLLTRLPVEVQIKICSYLNTYDLMQLPKILPSFEFCINERDLIRHIHLYREFRLEISDLHRVLKRPRTEIITYLNLNCIYWIPAKELRKCLTSLHALECLYAVDTKLSLSLTDCYTYQFLLNLKKIGLTFNDKWNKMEMGVLKCFPKSITHLYLHIDWITRETMTKLSHLIYEMDKLEELWVVDLSSLVFGSSSMDILDMLPKTIQRLTFVVRSVPNIALVSHYQLSGGVVSFRNKKRGYEVSFEKFDGTLNNIYQEWTFKDEAWDTLINYLKIEIPFCAYDTKLLILQKADLFNIKFREMNICHSLIFCSQLLKSTLNIIFLQPNMHYLKKLSVNICVAEVNADKPAAKDEPLFKKSRRDSRICLQSLNEGSSVLNTIVESCPLLEELELWECDSNSNTLQKVTNSSMAVIANLNHLRKLTIQGLPMHINGQFLIDICKSCQNLESLRIHSANQNNSLSNHLCLALPHTRSIRDLRYEQIYIPIDKLFESLNQIKEAKIERLVIKCKTVEIFRGEPFNEFLQTNSRQLRFLCIIISEMPKTVIHTISKAAHQYKNGREKVYIVTRDEAIFNRRMPIPNIHKFEMLYCNTEVSIVDIFNGFAKI